MHFLTIYLTYFGRLYGYLGPISLENKLQIGPILPLLPVLGGIVKESDGVGAGWVSPPAPWRFFTFQVLNGAILALFFIFLPFLLKK